MWIQIYMKQWKDNKGYDDSSSLIWRLFILQLPPEIEVTWVRWGVQQSISSQEKGTDAADTKELATLPL